MNPMGEMLGVINHPLALLSGRFLAAGTVTSKEGPVPRYTVLDCMAGIRHVYLRATSTNLIEQTNTRARYFCSPERHFTEMNEHYYDAYH